MHLAQPRPALARIALRVSLAMMLCSMGLGLTQCKLVMDNLTAPRATPEKAKDCFKECERAHHDALEAEERLHHENKKACHKDKDEDKDKDEIKACREREHDRHEAVKKAIKDEFKRCQNDCHHQGGGHGG